jgi:hypothetical protein
MIGAENQQERLKMASWISGFTDGEGSFVVSVIKNPTTRFGKQIFPEFVITQGAKSLFALEAIKEFFDCGNIVLNKRYDNHNEDIYRYCVRSISELETIIVPLKTYKQNDFALFKKVVEMMNEKQHLQENGWNEILEIASQMNRKKSRT